MVRVAYRQEVESSDVQAMREGVYEEIHINSFRMLVNAAGHKQSKS